MNEDFACFLVAPDKRNNSTVNLWCWPPLLRWSCRPIGQTFGGGGLKICVLLLKLATCVFCISAVVAHLVLCFMYKFILLCLPAQWAVYLVCHSIHRPKSSFINTTTCCSVTLHPFSTSMKNTLEFSSGNWSLYWKFLSIDRATCRLATRPPVCALWAVYLHKWWFTDQFSVFSDFHYVANINSQNRHS
jgi:hypothetical protein